MRHIEIKPPIGVAPALFFSVGVEDLEPDFLEIPSERETAGVYGVII